MMARDSRVASDAIGDMCLDETHVDPRSLVLGVYRQGRTNSAVSGNHDTRGSRGGGRGEAGGRTVKVAQMVAASRTKRF